MLIKDPAIWVFSIRTPFGMSVHSSVDCPLIRRYSVSCKAVESKTRISLYNGSLRYIWLLAGTVLRLLGLHFPASGPSRFQRDQVLSLSPCYQYGDRWSCPSPENFRLVF